MEWTAATYVALQLGNLVKFWHAREMVTERQCQLALAHLSGRPQNQLRFRGQNPARRVEASADQFATLKAAFERVCGEEGADADALVREVPQGALVLVMGDQVAEKAGELHGPSVEAQAAIVRDYLAELRGIEGKAKKAAEMACKGGEKDP